MMDAKRVSPYVDYNFYEECYHGDVINDSAFDKAELEAEAFIDEITFGRIQKLGEIPISVKFAVCSVLDVFANYSENKKNNLSSESNDGYSVTYSQAVTDSECRAEMLSRARRWLANTGLLYRGWSKKYDA